MIVKLTPKFKFVCDRCGKEIFPDSEDRIDGVHSVAFVRNSDIALIEKKTSGDICEECYKEFVGIAENFFDEVNKDEAKKSF